jgi:hypothetical protein
VLRAPPHTAQTKGYEAAYLSYPKARPFCLHIKLTNNSSTVNKGDETMRHSMGISLAMFVIYVTTLGQDHIPVSHQHSTDHGICWGYAMGRAGGKSDNDATCDPKTLIPDQSGIDGTYFREISWTYVDSLQTGDILYWTGVHAAYVYSNPPKDGSGHVIVGSIPVAHMSASQWQGVIYETLDSAKSRVGVGNPSSFWRTKDVSMTASNSFGAGDVKVGASTVASGSPQWVEWWHTITLTALNQDYQNVYRIWSNWQKSGEQNPTTENPRTITAESGASYTAHFSDWCDISFSNSFPGASGGTMSVWDTTRSAPGTVRMPRQTSFNITAINQVISRISYTFSQWSGDTSSANQTLSPTSYQHRSYTANFTSKPLPPDNVSAGGTVGDYPHITWTEHPNGNVTQYQIWRKVKENGVLQSPTQIATVNRGTTSYIDYDYLITSGYTDDICYYDVRSVFVVQGQATQYSDPSFTNGVFTTNNQKVVPESGLGGQIATAGEQPAPLTGPADYRVSIYPNPFNPSTTLSYQIPQDATVRLEIYDLIGRKVRSLVDGSKSTGYYRVVWNGRDETGRDVASGVYLYRFSATPIDGSKAVIRSGKLVLMR